MEFDGLRWKMLGGDASQPSQSQVVVMRAHLVVVGADDLE